MNGILLALRHRDRTGEGQRIDIALLDAMTSALSLPVVAHLNTGTTLTREGNQHHTLTPYETMDVADGLVVVAVGNPRLWTQFCIAIDAEELERDPRFATNTDRMAHRDVLLAELTRRVGSWTRDELIDRLRRHTVPCGQVRSIDEALDEPQLAAREMILEIPHAELGQVKTLGNPIKLSKTPAVIDRPPPRAGRAHGSGLAQPEPKARSLEARAQSQKPRGQPFATEVRPRTPPAR